MIEELIFKSKVPNFESIQTDFLNAIESMGKFSFINDGQSISHTDWHLSPNINRPYQHLAEYVVNYHNDLVAKHFNYKSVTTQNMWFQQYEEGDFHRMHTHGDASFSNVFFIELPNKDIVTKYFIRDKEYNFEACEGEIISFPGLLHHKSPVNAGGRKTVFVWNTSIK